MATTDKYDRQLRLWGASGQRALSETCVLLIRATAAGTETLKNLVLPGIGSFLIVDDALVTAQDISANFFVMPGHSSRAQVTCQLLQELNPDVRGSFLNVANLKQGLRSTQNWKQQILSALPPTVPSAGQIMVVGSDLEPPLKYDLARICRETKTKLILVQSYGLVGVVRLQTPPLPILNPKPRDTLPDLRLTQTFPALQELAQSVPWHTLDPKEHKHVPYPLILLKIIHEYRQQNNHNLPNSYAEKQAFIQMIQNAALDYSEQENFQEAVRNAHLAIASAGKPLDLSHLQSLLERAQEAGNLPFYVVLLRALCQFAQSHRGQPPLPGVIPDMTASTDWYVRLQTVYRQQALEDWKEMKQLVQDQLATVPGVVVSDEEMNQVCVNARYLDLISMRSVVEEMDQVEIPPEITQELREALEEEDARPEMVPLLWYLGLQACDLFYRQYARYPGTEEETTNIATKEDVEALHSFLWQVLDRYGLRDGCPDLFASPENNQNAALELCRFGNAEIHAVAAIVGGVAAQEAVKLITGQYTPFQNTYVYNGIASMGGVYKF